MRSVAIPVVPVSLAAVLRASAKLAIAGWRGFSRMVRVSRNRRVAQELARLDNRMLADIGISRSDLNDAFSEPFWEDPTVLLRARALEKRVRKTVTHENAALRPRPMQRPVRGAA